MAFVDTLGDAVDGIFTTSFVERDGRKIPDSTDIALSDGAVKLEATFLYADLAGSGRIASICPWDTTAKIIRAYLDCAVRLVRAWGGEIKSFDGDRVMGVFFGDMKNTYATRCAREIDWATEQIVQPKATAQFKSVKNNDVKIRQTCGIDTGVARAVRAGIRNNNDIIWIGKAPSFAAKLSDIRGWPYTTFISKAVYDKLAASERKEGETTIWEAKTSTFAGAQESIYQTKYMLKP